MGNKVEYPEGRAHLTTEALQPCLLEELVLTQACGATTTFCGRVRDHNEGERVISLRYEAYEPMALKILEEILRTCDAKYPTTRSVAHHRIGELSLGDIAVVVSVAAPHRAVTFEACSWIIDELKAKIPIFKHERRQNGEVWVGLGP